MSKVRSTIAANLVRASVAAGLVAAGVVGTAQGASAALYRTSCCTTVYNTPTPFVFSTNRDYGNKEIYSQNPDGSGLKRLTNNSAVDDQPSWDGSRSHIAFASNRGRYVMGIWIMNADGSAYRTLTPYGSWYTEKDPSLNAAGTKVAFTSNRSGSDQVWVINTDGTGATQITPNYDGTHSHPAWSPDGQRIAFVRNYNGLSDVYMTWANGAGMARVSFDGAVEPTYSSQAWSPDGQKIAYTSKVTGDDELFWSWAFTVQAPVQVTNRAGYDGQPTWSPDGSTILFTQSSGSVHNLVSTNTTGGNLKTVVSTGGANEAANWGYPTQQPMAQATAA